MIDAILRGSLSHRLAVLIAASVMLVWGAYTASRMPVDVFPDLTAPTVTVITEGHGMAPEELETRVTLPIESSLNGAPGVRRVRSATGVGISVIYAEFDWGTDIYRARQTVSEKLQLVRDTLPAEVEAPVLAPISSIMGEILFLAVTTGNGTEMEARAFADFTLRRRLLAVAGVSQVIVTGGERRQFEVVLRPERLAAQGVTVGEVVRALEETNANVSAGFVNEGGQEYLVHGIGRVRTPEDVAETLVTWRGEQPVLVRHLGEVRMGAALSRGKGSFGGQPAVIVGVQKQPGSNTLELTRRIDRELDELSRTLPEGMTLQRDIFRQADFIEVAIGNVLEALRDGVVLVLLIVLAFLRSGRASAITLIAIPLSLVTAVFALSAFGATLNTMTLGGMAIAVGELVDDAVIDVENVVRRLRQNALLPEDTRRPALEIVLTASQEIRGSIVFATLIVVLVFLPLFFLSGVEGRLLQPLGVAYVVSLAASLFVAVTLTPVLCSYLLPGSKAVSAAHEPRLSQWLKQRYTPLLERAIQRWRLVASVSFALLATAGAALALSGRSFLPEFREGTLTIAAVTLPGTSLAGFDATGRRLEQILLRHPEVVSVARRTGRAEMDEHAQGVNAAELDVSLRETDRSREEFLEALRRDFSLLPGVSITIGQPISHRIDHMLSGTRASIAVKVFGDDLAELRRVGTEVEAAMRGVPGVVDLSREQQADIPLVRVRFDRVAIARHGLRVADVARALEVGSGVHVVSQVMEGQAVFDLVVRTEPSRVQSLEDLQELLVTTPRGARVPLRALAHVHRDRGPNEIGRENVQRKLVVSCNLAGRDVVSVVRDIQTAVERSVRLPAGYQIVYGGQFESAEGATHTLGLLGLACLVGMFGLLYTAFGSVRDAVLVMVNLPLALIGGAAGVLLQGGVLSIASLVGFITLFGIATRNGIMLVSHIRHLVHAEGVRNIDEAIRRGAQERLVPILMTALAAGLGLVPLALSGGEPGSEIQAPMAIVILCGLSSSTALNMFVVPALYRRFGALAREGASARGVRPRRAR
ncbi:multidrug transporter AcrB [Cystobacter fuscus]|uniref:Multidrug transporter AcrB n=1 Tax=Cystobacter fuscus TaxID=43 RepID=A0A250J899_9BACT|nr:efflux RND transporter permease subunit [Cystobacter fuscus]ATB39661.1 multidrug transporter AcrB [Cystobacter fuscus]